VLAVRPVLLLVLLAVAPSVLVKKSKRGMKSLHCQWYIINIYIYIYIYSVYIKDFRHVRQTPQFSQFPYKISCSQKQRTLFLF
jgi:hypothetical protein